MSFTDSELRVLLCLADTFIPSLNTHETSSFLASIPGSVTPTPLTSALQSFASHSPSQCPEFIDNITTLASVLPAIKLAELKQFLNLLSGRLGAIVFTGRITDFCSLPRPQREAVVLSWKSARLPLFRRLFASLSATIISQYLKSSEVAWAAMQYPGPMMLEGSARKPSGHPFVFETRLDGLPAFDVVVVGSGSGGGVAAKVMAESGMKVLVVEKGEHVSGEVSIGTKEALGKRFERGGSMASVDGSVVVVAGSGFGGGSAVNWAASLQTPAKVRKDWSDNHGLPLFMSKRFQESLDSVCQFMGVTPPSTHNHANATLLAGAHNLGLSASPVPQNTASSPHACDHHCAFGCYSGGKQGTQNSFLPHAAQHGAHFLTNAYCTRIAFSDDGSTLGVYLRIGTSKEAFVRCPRVVLAAGALHTPAILLRSGVKNPHVGKNLYLHPTAICHARYPKIAVRPWQGNILTTVVSEHANLTPTGHGVRIETVCMVPPLGTSTLPWCGGAAWKATISRYNSFAGYISIVRDRDSGCVVLDPPTGEPVVEYSASEFDVGNVLKGIETCAEIVMSAGAEEFLAPVQDLPVLTPGMDPKAWRKALWKGGAKGRVMLGSAHQMGTARMGRTGKEGVCNPQGQVWGRRGTWIADASVLPSASGVNPMVTVMAVAEVVAQEVVESWKKEVGKGRALL